MIKLSKSGSGVFLSGLVLIIGVQLLTEHGDAAIRPPQQLPEYQLHVSFDVPNGKIFGPGNHSGPQGMKLAIDPGVVKIKGLTHNGKRVAVGHGNKGKEIVLHAAGPVHLIYEGDLRATKDNTIDNRGIFLQGQWYPSLEGFCRFRLTATLPTGYVAISEADRITQTEKNSAVNFSFDYPYPVHDQRGISFAASKYLAIRTRISNFAPISLPRRRIWPPATWNGSSTP